MNRLSILRKQKNMTQGDLAKLLGIAQSTLSGWETQKFEIDDRNKLRIADYFGVTIDYLLGRSDDPVQRTEKKGVKIPVLGRVAAGIPITAVEDILDYEEIDESIAKTGEFFGLKIKGDSMEPMINDGDVVIVRKQEDVKSGEVAIVLVNGDDATCKKLVKHDNGISLISYNPTYAPLFYTIKEIETLPVQVVGRVMELRRTF